MRDKKDWSYFKYEVGQYEPFCFASEEEKKKFVPYKPQTKKLQWFVFAEDYNAKKIVTLNVFEGSSRFIDGLLRAKKQYKDDYLKIAEAVRVSLHCAYGSKCEWETIITSWPTYVDAEEVERLIKVKQQDIEKYGKFRCTDVGLEVEYKIDVYTQVMMNWDRFIEYVWNNNRLITEKKLR